jgi:hypothetical protein
MMSNFIDEEVIAEYLIEHKSLDVAIAILEERQGTIDDILRNYHNFTIGKDRLINVGG